MTLATPLPDPGGKRRRKSPEGERYATPDEKAKAVRLWRAGLTLPQVAQRTGFGAAAIHRWRNEAGVSAEEAAQVVFERRVEFDPNVGCWLWSGDKADHYGRVTVSAHAVAAHRVAWELYRGPIPDGLNVLHRCDTPLCVNPAHLFLGTQADNVADMHRKGRNADFTGDRNPRRRAMRGRRA